LPLRTTLPGLPAWRQREEIHLLGAAVFYGRQLIDASGDDGMPGAESARLGQAAGRVAENAQALARALEAGQGPIEVEPAAHLIEEAGEAAGGAGEPAGSGPRMTVFWLERVDEALTALGDALRDDLQEAPEAAKAGGP
jgi:hypothetical protein